MTEKKERGKISRRDFLVGMAGTTAAIASASALSACAPKSSSGSSSSSAKSTTVAQIATELSYPGQADAPSKTEYTCDVLVIGGGWAGLHAAVTAAKAGKSVVLVDKGKPGYSGAAPFAGNGTYFDAQYDTAKEWILKGLMHTGEYIANVDDFSTYLDGSKAAEQENIDWGLQQAYDKSGKAGYNDFSQAKDYFQSVAAGKDRHARFVPILQENNIEVVDHTMVTNLITSGGACIGAVGFHYKSATVVSFSAKAVVLCTGPSSVKPAGYVTSGNTFDGEYMAYQAGCRIIGKEFDDFHQQNSYAPGDFYYTSGWDYMQPRGDGQTFALEATDDAVNTYASGKASYMVVNRVNQTISGIAPNDGAYPDPNASRASHGVQSNPDDPRTQAQSELGSTALAVKFDAYGAAPGMSTHMNSGVFCGSWNADDGAVSDLPGLFVAGDGTKGDAFEGTVYCYIGTTTNGCSYQGDRAGASAAKFAESAKQVAVPADQLQAATDEIMAPSKNTKGFDPNQVIDQLQAAMLNPLVHINTSAASLNGALTTIEYLRDNVIPKMCAYTGHDLRLAIEAKHKCLGAELKVRAKLAREESRGMHYRSDFPYRDDANFLCHLGLRKGSDGAVQVEKIAIPDSWKGDTSLAYDQRYVWRFPGEAQAKGLSGSGMYEKQ